MKMLEESTEKEYNDLFITLKEHGKKLAGFKMNEKYYNLSYAQFKTMETRK